MKQFTFSIAVALVGYAGTNAWTPLGPYGGIVTTLAADPGNPGTLYAATGVSAGNGRLYKTTDGGANWILLNSALGAASIAIDPQNTNTIYVGLQGTSAAWVFKSTDGGASFRLANSGLEAVQFHGHLAVDPMNPGTVYAAMRVQLRDPCMPPRNCFSTQVYKTTDEGASWGAASAGLPQADSFITALAVDPQDSRILYAGAPSGIFKSTNAGASWVTINSSVAVCCTYFSQGLVIDPLNHDTLYAASFGGIVKLSSAGTILSTAPLGGGNITSLMIDQRNSGALYAAATIFTTSVSSSSIFKSTDGGITWAATAFDSQENGTFSSLAVDQSSGTVYAGAANGYGVLKTTDGGANWMEANYGLGNFDVRSVTVDPRNSGTLYALSSYPQGVFKTMDGGRNWAALRGLQSAESLLVDPRHSNALYAVTRNAILKSADGGATWNEAGHESWRAATAVLAPNGRYFFLPGALVMDPQNPDTLYVLAKANIFAPGCCRTDILKSTDGGTTWSTTAKWGGNDVTLLLIDPRNSSTLYAAGVGRATISKSTDGGATWIESRLPVEAIQIDDDDFWGNVLSTAVDPQDSNVVYATGSGGIFRSTDGGVSWTTMNSGLARHTCIGRDDCFGEPYQVDSLVVDPQKSTLYVDSRAGILRSTDGGSSWSQVNAGLPAPLGANSLALDPSNPSTLYAAGGGVYTITFAPEMQ